MRKPGKDTEERLGENPRHVVPSKSREKNGLRRKRLLTVLNDAEMVNKIALKKVHRIWQHGDH